MNRGKYGRTTLSVVLVAVMALVLQGCGGDDNNGMEQDLKDQVAMLEGQLSDAETAQMAAEAAQMAAEEAAADAMTTQMAAEAERAAANTAKGAAEQAQTTAEAAQMTAEEAQTAAEAAQMTAEAAQTAAIQAQVVAEAERDAATGTLSAAEMARDAAKDAEATAKIAEAEANAAKMAAEGERDDSNAAKMAAEASQAAAEMERDAANAAKMMAEEAQMAAAAAQAAAEKAAMDAAAAQATAEKAAEDAMAAQMAAEMERDTAQAAQATAEKAAMDAQAAQATAEKAAEDAKSAQTAAEMERDNYKQMLAELQGDADTDEMMDASAEAKALYAALVDPPSPDLLTNDDLTDGERPDVTVDVENGMLKAEVTNVTGYTMAAAPDMIEGWMGAMLEHEDGHVAVVYSDRGTDGGKPLFDLYTNFTPPADGKPRSYPVNNAVASGAEAIETDLTDMELEWIETRRPDSITTGGATAGSAMFQGSVRGVPGTFSCESACIAPTRFTDGVVNVPTTSPGDWVFVPDDPNAVIAGADSAYLTLGWWLQKDAGGMASAYRPIAMSTGMDRAIATNAPGTLEGTATYKGAAAGKYALPSTTDDTYEGGHFTAMATIEADFDVDNDATAPGNQREGIKLSGMIDNFMTGDVSRDWTVKLMVDGTGGPLSDVADRTPLVMDPVANLGSASGEALASAGAALLTTEWSMGGTAAKTTGKWAPVFYHLVSPATTAIPDAVTGTFDAAGDLGRLRGAFGANKVME